MNGRVITFYSYKGGTGRSFLLANVAWILASQGHRVLMVDWDLEAPGLHRYFHPFLKDQYLRDTPGVIDWVFDYQTAVAGLGRNAQAVPENLLARLADPSPYIVEIDVTRYALANFGKLHLLPAGQQTSEYATRVNRFNWLQLYENLGGAVFLKRAREEMVGQYDYVLIDSRTGVSDTSGISTLALPDKLVVCFTLNSQSVVGASNVAKIARDARAKSSDEYDIFPVPTRVDRSEKLKLQISRQVARDAFADFPLRLDSSAAERYWGDVEVPYESFYAYEEVLATFGDEPGELTSILASSERLASFLTGHRIYLAPTEHAVRKEILGQYLRRSELAFNLGEAADRVFAQLGSVEQGLARQLFIAFVFQSPDGRPAARSIRPDRLPDELHPILERFRAESVIEHQGDDLTLADPQLVGGWSRFARWIENDWEFLRWRSDLQVRLDAWLAARRAPDLLLPTSLVTAATSWFDRRKSELASTELEFIAASERHLQEARELEQRAEQERREQELAMRTKLADKDSQIESLHRRLEVVADDSTKVKARTRVWDKREDFVGVTKLIVAVHGSGEQKVAIRQAVTKQFWRFGNESGSLPLGTPKRRDPVLYDRVKEIAFAEVSWGAIPRRLVAETNTLQETKLWAHDIVDRLRTQWQAANRPSEYRSSDFEQAEQIVNELLHTVEVVDRFSSLTDMAGLFTFDMKRVLDDDLGDAQIVTEFEIERRKILDELSETIEAAYEALVGLRGTPIEIHIVSHGEGTVVTLLALLEAFRKSQVPTWAHQVRGLMTLGSPIDHHLGLWPKLFAGNGPTAAPTQPIEWRNYHDYGDPFGSDLSEFRDWRSAQVARPDGQRWTDVFTLTEADDFGFSRYPFPGEAHRAYWNDSAVFGHFIATVVKPLPAPDWSTAPRPATKRASLFVSWVLPYVAILALLWIASFIICKAVEVAVLLERSASGTFKDVTSLAFLMAGITIAARVPRLTRRWRLRAVAVTTAAICASGYITLWDVRFDAQPLFEMRALLTVVGAAVLVLIGTMSTFVPQLGAKPMIAIGALAVVATAASILTRGYASILTPGYASVWPILLVSIPFLYLWWLASILFDLVVVWHVYVRGGVAKDIVRYIGRASDKANLAGG